MIVVDASLVVKWLFREFGTDEAVGFLRQHRGAMAAPDLLFIEVAGVIVRRVNERRAYREDALETAQIWARTSTDQVIEPYRLTEERLVAASSIALAISHPLKDCLYDALARELDCDLATCDVKLRDKAVDFYPRVRLLADYSASPDSSA